jgi:hypothetical protein
LLRISGPFLAFLLLAGCGSGEFSVNGALQARPVQLDGEQLALDQGQVDCGARDELWEITSLGDTRAVGRLTKKGRDLQFSDDVQIGDPAVGLPYVQIRGSFPVRVIQVGSVRDEDQYTKLADARIAVHIDNSCFQMNPPTLMGIRHGQFDPSANPVFRFKMDGGWMVDQIVH